MDRHDEQRDLICPTCGGDATVETWWVKDPYGNRSPLNYTRFLCDTGCLSPTGVVLARLVPPR